VRANAARVLGATEDKASFAPLLDRALKDPDSRVRVSAIRAVASLKDDRAATPLLERGEQLLSAARTRQAVRFPSETNEILEIATALGRLLQTAKNSRAGAVRWLRQLRTKLELSPEVEVAFARVSPQLYQIQSVTSVSQSLVPKTKGVSVAAGTSWSRWASVGQGLAELALVKSGNPMLDANIKEQATNTLHDALACPPYSRSPRKYEYKVGDVLTVRCVPMPQQAVPDFLRALAAFKPKDLDEVLRKHLSESDVVVRSTAADLLGELPPDDTNAGALIEALPVALADQQLNDAALSILDALGKQKSTKANDAIKTALDSTDYLIRRKAVAVLKENGAGDFSSRIGTVQTRNTAADYERAIARLGKQVTAVVTTSKGSFTINLLPDEATLTVDNFVQLARRQYFNGFTVPRVVPNFVMQDGDPRGDGNGGPGYQIRCEINEVPYARGAVGMALSGKDTGGSQWFVTHSPQPHLDGGYTVFGNVVSGMEVVDAIARGDVISSIVIKESAGRGAKPPR
jgi:cyclophilin family peptidyl-prolyl cis-trans isomerase